MSENGRCPLSPGTLQLLRDLLAAQTLPVGDPAFRATAERVMVALDELDKALAGPLAVV